MHTRFLVAIISAAAATTAALGQQSATINLAGAQFRNAVDVSRNSAPQTIQPAARYHTVIGGLVRGQPFLSPLYLLFPNPTPLATAMETLAPGSSAALDSYGINPTSPPTHPFVSSSQILAGSTVIAGITVNYGATIQAGIDAGNITFFSLTGVILTPTTIGYLSFDSGSAVITRIPCPTDVDGNHLIEPADIASFVNTWFTSLTAGTLAGDYNLDGTVTPADIALFVGEWFATLSSGGCPS